jgi:hypothetical protein
MAEHVVAILQDYKIEDKLFCITTDGASNNDTMATCLQRRLLEIDVDWDPQTQHINCLNHVINLAVQAFLRELKVVQPDGGDDDDNLDPDSPLKEPEGSFARVMEKIRGVAKVLHIVTLKDFPYFYLDAFVCDIRLI